MKKLSAELFLNKEVQIYPGDTYSKYGIVKSVEDDGVTFLITRSNANNYTPGKLHFISFASKLSMREV